MSAGRFILRGRVFQGRAFAPWALTNSGTAAPSVEVITRRLTLVGCSRYRYEVQGTSGQRLTALGTSAERITIEGSSP